MQNNLVALSSLHTGSAAPLYASVGKYKVIVTLAGWKAVFRYQVTIPFGEFLDWSKEIVSHCKENYNTHQFAFDNEEKLKSIAKIHEKFNLHFNGPLARSLDYWKLWIVEESKYAIILEDDKQNLIGYANVCPYRKNGSALFFRDMCVDENMISGQTFLAKCVLHYLKWNGSQENPAKFTTIILPSPILHKFFANQPWPFQSKEEVDEGFMYRTISDPSSPELKDINLFSFDEKQLRTTHLFWDIDAF
jgi:hypothetical protein